MLEPERISRRVFVKRTGLLLGLCAFPGLVSACGDSGEGSGASPSALASLSAADVDERLASAAGTVRTLLWEGYADEAAYAPLLQSGQIQLRNAFIVNNDDVDMLAKRGTYDIGVGVDGIYPQLRAAGAMQPLDLQLIPNLSQVFDSSQMFAPGTHAPPLTVLEGQTYGIPFAWGLNAVTYKVDSVPRPPKSIEDFLEPAYKGKLGLGDDFSGAIIHVARHLGLGGTDSLGRSPAPTFLTKADLDRVFVFLNQLKAQTKGLISNPYGEYVSSYARGEIIAAMPDWAPTAVAAQDGGVNVELSVVPSSRTFIDCFFISSEVEATDAMYAFLNQALAEETQYAIGKKLIVAVMNEKALDRLVKEGPGWQVYGDVDKLLEVAPSQEWPPIASDKYTTLRDWLARWQEFKAS